MPSRIPFLAAVFAGCAAFTVPASCMACSLVPADALLLKQMMAKEIAFRLAINVEQVPLNDITPPALHRPLELGADCSGLAAFHHSSGFSIVVVTQQHAFATMGKPHTAAGTGSRYRGRFVGGRWPGAGVRPDYWRAPPSARGQGTPEVDYSGYRRWPQYPTERQFAASSPALPVALVPQRWPRYPDESALQGRDPAAAPVRWSTLGVLPATPPGQGFCRYEGVAVVLGYGSSSPVAVNFEQQCD